MRRSKDLSDITHRGYSQVRRTCCNKFIKMIMIMTSILFFFLSRCRLLYYIYLVLRWLDYFHIWAICFRMSHYISDISFDLFGLFECLKSDIFWQNWFYLIFFLLKFNNLILSLCGGFKGSIFFDRVFLVSIKKLKNFSILLFFTNWIFFSI